MNFGVLGDVLGVVAQMGLTTWRKTISPQLKPYLRHRYRCHMAWFCAVLTLLLPVLPVWAEELQQHQANAQIADIEAEMLLYDGHPIVEALRGLKPTLGVPGDWEPGTDMRIGNLVYRPGSLSRAVDGRLSMTIAVFVCSGDGLLQIGTANTSVGRNGIHTTSTFTTGTESWNIDGSLYVADNGNGVLLESTLNGGEQSVTHAVVGEDLVLVAGDEYGFRQATSGLDELATEADSVLTDQTSGDPEIAASIVLAIVGIIALIVFGIIVVCTYGAILGWFLCEGPVGRSRHMKGKVPWLQLELDPASQPIQPVVVA